MSTNDDGDHLADPERCRRVRQDSHRFIEELLVRGTHDHALIRGIADLPDITRGLNGKERKLGAHLLVETVWDGVIELGDPTTQGLFKEWRGWRG